MRIAFVSYEFPPDTGIGGIGTYTYHIAHLFGRQGIDVEVICASQHRSGAEKIETVTIVRIQCENPDAFYRASPRVLLDRNRLKPFDLVEVPEYGAGGLHLKNVLNIPLVIKLHTPAFLVKEINNVYYDHTPLRRVVNTFKKKYAKESDPEYRAVMQADFILSPSLSLKGIIENRWKPAKEIIHAPNPFSAGEAFLRIPVQTDSNVVLYTGRLETRKGVWNLAKAIPQVLEKVPDATFIFVGSDDKGPFRETSMKKRMLHEIGNNASQVRFVDRVPMDELLDFMHQAAVCVYPSLWENFPNVCLEAMAAGRAVAGSRQGGMADMLSDVPGAMLVDPHSVPDIAAALVHLLLHPEERIITAQAGREKIKHYYNGKLVSELIALYRSFINEKAL
jgi:glycosyltransferase involved in cell wall biosynthesis